MARVARWSSGFNGVFRLRAVTAALKTLVDLKVTGPDADARARTPTFVWGEVRNAGGTVRTARLRVGNGYDVTVHGALGIVDMLLTQDVQGGAWTPARLMGHRYVQTLPGSGEIAIV
jgi:short subunit dehydrogenase-like uncharacterized protein